MKLELAYIVDLDNFCCYLIDTNTSTLYMMLFLYYATLYMMLS